MENKIIWFEAARISPLEFNPRVIKDDSFRKLQQSILNDPDFMTVRPILLNKIGQQYFVYAGTQRWRACKDLGWETVPVIISENLSEEVVKARMIKDNVHAGIWDASMLEEFDNSVLERLDIEDFNKFDLKFGDKDGDSSASKGVNNHKEKAGAGSNLGGFPFNLVFDTHDDKKEFEKLVKSLEGTEHKTIAAIIVDKAKNFV